MAKQRPIVGDLSQRQLNPQASPVDTFHTPLVAPPVDRSAEVKSVLMGLSTLGGGLQDWASKEQENSIIEGQAQAVLESRGEAGLAADREANKQALGKASRKGQIPPGANPWFQKGMRIQRQRMAAAEYSAALSEAWAKSSIRNSDDQAEVLSFMEKFQEQFAQDRGLVGEPEYAQVFAPMANQAKMNLMGAHASNRVQVVEQTVLQNTGREIMIHAKNSLDGGESPEAIAATVGAIIEEQFQNGLPGDKAHAVASKALIESAKTNLDLRYLEALANTPANKQGDRLGDIPAIAEDIRQAEEYISARTAQKMTEDRTRQKLEKEQTADALKTAFHQTLDKNPFDPQLDEIIRTLDVVDPDEGQTVRGWRTTFLNDLQQQVTVPEDPMTVAQVTAKVYEGNGSKDEIFQLLREQRIRRTTATSLLQDLEKSKQFRFVLNDAGMVATAKALENNIRGSAEYNFDRPEFNAKALQAGNAFRRSMMDWEAKHPEASHRERMEEALKLQQTLIGIYGLPGKEDGKDVQGSGVTPESALSLPKDSVPWQEQFLWKSYDDFKLARAEYLGALQTGKDPKTTKLGALAAHLGVAPIELMETQGVRGKQQAAAKPSTPQPTKK